MIYRFPELVGGPADGREQALEREHQTIEVPYQISPAQDFETAMYRRHKFYFNGADIVVVAYIDRELPQEIAWTMICERMFNALGWEPVEEEP